MRHQIHRSTMTTDSISRAVRRDMPARIFARRPWRILWFAPIVLSILVLSLALVLRSWPPALALTLSILVGHQYACLFFFGHELSHGSMTASSRLQNALLYFCYLIYCMPPRFTHNWHFAGHHAHTNVARRDTDTYGMVEEFALNRRTKYLFRFTPGSGHWLSVFYVFTFAVQAQVLLWFRIRGAEFRGYSRVAAAIESLSMMMFWTGLAFAIGTAKAVLVIAVPMLVASAVVMAYGATNHGLRPLSEQPDQISGSMSVTTFRILDRLHFHFSHHTEHHLFPSVASCYAPLIRRSLERHAPQEFLAPPHWKALVVVFLTPRMYAAPDVLANPFTGRRVPIQAVESALRAPRWIGLRALRTTC